MTKQRKFTAYLVTLVITAILCFQGAVTGEEFISVIKVATTVFVLGNSAEHYFEKVKSNG